MKCIQYKDWLSTRWSQATYIDYLLDTLLHAPFLAKASKCSHMTDASKQWQTSSERVTDIDDE